MSRQEAMDKMAESLSNLVDLKITVPLSKKTKNIHTNSFIYYEPPWLGDEIDGIYGEIRSTCKPFRYTFYRRGYWYVKGVNISYKNGTMELTLSPMPTPYTQEKLNKTSAVTSTTSSQSKTNESKTDNISAPSWLSKSDRKWAESFVRTAIKGSNNKLTRAKRVYKAWKKGYKYTYYKNLRYTSPKGNREKAYRRGSGNCADGANILCTLMLTAGINARIKHPPNHYIVKLKIDGKTYWVDNHGRYVTWNQVWHNTTSNNEANISNGVYING